MFSSHIKGNKMAKFSLKVVLASVVCLSASQTAVAQSATPIYDQMSTGEYGVKFSLEQRKLCLLALKTVDYGVKELGLDKADSKKAVRAEKGLPFTAIELEKKTQTKVLFDRAVAEVKSEFLVFKNADEKTQKKLFSAAKKPNKTCAKPYVNRKLEGYGRGSAAADYISPMSSEEALLCMSVASNTLGGSDRTAVVNGILSLIAWEEVYRRAVRREGLPDDQLVEMVEYKEMKAKASEVGEARALAAYDTCPAKYKKAKFQADLKKDEPTEVPSIDWN